MSEAMKARLVVAILVMTILAPIASSHGANETWIIMRGSSIQPNEAEVLQNDSLVFYNVADYNRTIRVDLDGNGEYDQRCETEASNSSSIRDECVFLIDSMYWLAGEYRIDVFSNDTLWKTLNLTVIHDNHVELGPPNGYSFNNENGTPVEEEDRLDKLEDGLMILAIFLFVAAGIARNARGEEDA